MNVVLQFVSISGQTLLPTLDKYNVQFGQFLLPVHAIESCAVCAGEGDVARSTKLLSHNKMPAQKAAKEIWVKFSKPTARNRSTYYQSNHLTIFKRKYS